MESSTLTNQTPTKDTPEQTPIPGTYKRGVFLARLPGQSFEEFQNFCVESFRKAGMLTEAKPKEPELKPLSDNPQDYLKELYGEK